MKVACLRIADFLVALARRDTLALAGRPIVIGGSPEEHATVTACSREAADAGVHIGMTLRRALALCPGAVFLPVHEGVAAQEGDRIVEELTRCSPAVEAIEPGHAHFEVGGLAALARMTDADFLGDVQEGMAAVTGLRASLGAGETVFAAHAAAVCAAPGSPPVLVPNGGDARTFLAPLPVEVLPISPLMHQRLRLLGLERLGQVAEIGFTAMQAQFGREGARAWELARGHDRSRVTPRVAEVRISEELDLPAPTVLTEPLLVGTRALLQRAIARDAARGYSVRRLDWRLGLESGEQIARRCVFREPTGDPARMLFAMKVKIERLLLPAAAVSVGVTLSGLCSEYGRQRTLWAAGPRRFAELVDAIEQLNTRVGSPQVYRIAEVQAWSRIPERQLGLVAFGP